MLNETKEKIKQSREEAERIETELEVNIMELTKESYKENFLIKKYVYIYRLYSQHKDEEQEIDLNNLFFCYDLVENLEKLENIEEKDETTQEAIRSYNASLDLIEENLTTKQLAQTIDFYKKILVYTNEALLEDLAQAFYLIKRFKGTPKEDKLIALLKSYKEDLEEIVIKDTKGNIKKIQRNRKLAQIRSTIFRLLINNMGRTLSFEESNLEPTGKEDKDYYITLNNKGVELESTLEDILENYITIEAIKNDLQIVANTKEDLLEKKQIYIIKEDAKKELESIDTLDLLEVLEEIDLTDLEALFNFFYNCFSVDPTIKEIVKEKLKLEPNIIEDKLKEKEKARIQEQQEEKKIITLEDIIEPISKEQKEEAIEIANEEPNEWHFIKVNNSPIMLDINKASSKLFSYIAPTITQKENRLKELQSKRDLTHEEIEEIVKTEEDLEEEKQQLELIDKEIEKTKKEITELEEEERKADLSYKERESIKKRKKKRYNELKQLNNLLAEYKQENKYTQLELETETGLAIISAIEGGIKAEIEATKNLKYSIENTRLNNFIENKYYRTHEEDRSKEMTFTLKEYADENYIEPSSTTKASLLDALENLKNIKINVTREYTGYTDKVVFNRAGAIGTRNYKNINGEEIATKEDIFYIDLTSPFKRILDKNTGSFEARIPRIINMLGARKETHLAYELGNIIYRDLRINLKNQKIAGLFSIKKRIKFYIEPLEKQGALARNTTNKYSRRVIEPLRKAFNTLIDIGLIELTEEEDTNPFIYYDNAINKKGLNFEERNIIIIFKVYDEETYNKIIERCNKESRKKKRKRTTRK